MKKFGLFLMSALALVALASCNDDLEVAPNESYYASLATITSSDSNVTITGNEAEVTFKVEGGTVTLTVDCGCEWTATSYKPEYFTATTTSTSVTITAVQNTVENELAGVVSLMTAGESIQFAKIQVYQNAYGAPEITVSSNEWNAPAVGALTTEISVTASDEWDIENTAEWLTVEKTGTGISLAATENEETEERTAKVVLTCTDGIRSDSETITVTQDGKAYITLSEESVSFSSDGASATVTVESNFDWDYSYDTSNGWLTVTRNGDVLTVTASANDSGDDREETITFTAGDGAENTAEEQLTISQATTTVRKDMIFTYTISSANTTTKLPLSGTVNCTVDWGDGSAVETVTSVEPSHTYATAGEYDITISGTVTALNSNNISYSGSANTTLTAVKQWGETGLTDMTRAFSYCEGLVSLPEATGDVFADVTSFTRAFYHCKSLKEIPKDLFACSTKVTDLSYVFQACSSLTEVPAGLLDNCAAVTNLKSFLYNCPGITEIPTGMFDNCPLVNDMSYIFYGWEKLKSIPAGLFDKNTKATAFMGTFYDCKSITEIPTGLFDNCPDVEDFSFTFSMCESVKVIPSGIFDNCPAVNTFECCFQCWYLLEEIPEGLFVNCPKVETFESTFNYCTSLKEIPSDIFSKNLEVTSFYQTFGYETAVTGESPFDMIDGEKVHLYERSNYPSIYVIPEETKNCFLNSTGLTDYYSIPSSWGGGGN